MMTVLTILFQASSGPVVGFCLEKMLTPGEKTKARWQRILYWSLPFLLFGVLKAWFSTLAAVAVMDVVLILLALWLLHRLYRETEKEKRLAFVLLLVAQLLSEGIYSLFFVRPTTMELDFSKREMALGSLVAAMIGFFLQIGVCETWCRLRKKQKAIKWPGLFGIFMLAELVPLMLFFHQWVDIHDADFHQYMLIFSCMLFAAFCLAYVLYDQAEKDQVEQELNQMRELANRERQHYADIEERREEMAKIRHDYGNLTASVLHLLQNGDVEEAKDLLQELSARIQSTKEYPYCGIPIVNAVLEEKKLLCDRHHIALRTELLLPDRLPVSHLDLCSALGNLLDNAIRACQQIETGRPSITLMAGLVSGYLVIKCQNPSPKAPGENPDGTGYGLKILSDIAARYQGDFFTEYQGGAFTAQLSLLLPRGEKAKKLP